MPIAGPISILIASNALKGKLRYCNLLTIGAGLADFIYILLAVYGISHLLSAYKNIIPYILLAGAFFILLVGIKIIRAKFDTYHIDEEQRLADKQDNKHRGAIYTGFILNFLNPTLFFGWLISSFITLSFASSLGFNTGGLAKVVDSNLEQIQKIEGNLAEKPKLPSYLQFDTLNILRKENQQVNTHTKQPVHFHFITSLFYAFFLMAGTILWFFLLTLMLVRFRKKIKIEYLNWFVRFMGIILCFFAVFFCYTALKMIF